MNKHILESNNFTLSIECERFSEEYGYNDTIMHVSVKSLFGNGHTGFSGYSDMEIDLKDFIKFSNDLKLLYNTLNGNAKITECFMEQYIEFSGDGKGHIFIKGFLRSYDEFMQKLTFANSIDQTYFKNFIDSLTNECSLYTL